MSTAWDFPGMVQDVQLMHNLGRDLANSRDWPNWVDSEFRAVRDVRPATVAATRRPSRQRHRPPRGNAVEHPPDDLDEEGSTPKEGGRVVLAHIRGSPHRLRRSRSPANTREDAPWESINGRPHFLHAPDVARTDRPLDARGGRRALRNGGPRIWLDHEGRALSGDQSHGKGSGHRPQGQGGDRGCSHLLLSRRRISGKAPRATACRARRLLSWIFFTSGPIEAAFSNKAAGWEPTPEKQRMFGYGNYDLAIGTLEKTDRRQATISPPTISPPPTCSSAPTSISCLPSTCSIRVPRSSITRGG